MTDQNRSEPEFVEVYRAKDDFQAQLLKAALEDAGIRAQVVGEVADTLYHLGWSTEPRILVAEADVPRATEILRELDQPKEIADDEFEEDVEGAPES